MQTLMAGPLAHDLDIGLATKDHLAAELSRLAEGRISTDEAVRLWLSVFSPNLKLWGLLELLSRSYRLAAFSNNPPFVRQSLPTGTSISTVILSSEIGSLKPDPASFAAAQTLLQVAGDEILFIDDVFTNVITARGQGWSAWHYRSPEALLSELRRCKLL